ncbi:MAG: MGH1-like glycoside hydrolase domain-containing protein [Chitinophagaceae bacterium]
MVPTPPSNPEQQRLDENALKVIPLEKWGPYLSERQWGTVREDYSANGDAWQYLPHDHARSRAYRWGEDGLGGISDLRQRLCFALTLWNGRDPILKERLFGLSGPEGNHGEDVKELYYHLDNTPTHSYMQYLYKYPQQEYPYQELLDVNRSRSREEPEYEILDTGIFNDSRYFDVLITYAKNNSEDILIQIEVTNRYHESARLIVLPTLWFRNKWSFGLMNSKPEIKPLAGKKECSGVVCSHETLGTYFLYFPSPDQLLFTENETNQERLFGIPNPSPYVKDAFHEVIVQGNGDLLRDRLSGTKAAPVFDFSLEGGQTKTFRLRLSRDEVNGNPLGKDFDQGLKSRQEEADLFYQSIPGAPTDPELRSIQRKAFAGILWGKQFYNYDIDVWLNGDKGQPIPPSQRLEGRNHLWKHLNNEDILSMPDKWEYPWYAAWDLAFHCVTLALIDPVFAKSQLILIMREWYMYPNGQIPAYEWNFSDVNPPVHAWAALQIYRIEKTKRGKTDVEFLKRVFLKLMINFTWWVNRKDANGNNIFEGGFLGLDNISLFNRSNPLPDGGLLEQADGTSWMGMYALNMMELALEIAVHDPSFQDVATKFYEHFVYIADSLNDLGLWNEEDQFFYDVLSLPQGKTIPVKARTMVGLTALFAVCVIDHKLLEKLPDFSKRINWFRKYRTSNGKYLPNEQIKTDDNMLFSLVHKDKLIKILQRVFDEQEFLAPGGIRSVSAQYRDNPYTMNLDGRNYSIDYEPGEATVGLFGGNSNWRGPVWMPMNFLLIKALQAFHQFYGDEVKLEFPTGSGNWLNLDQICRKLAQRLIGIFRKDPSGNRPVNGQEDDFYRLPENQDLILFYEYFHGDTSMGLGASHQTGWTALISVLIDGMKA